VLSLSSPLAIITSHAISSSLFSICIIISHSFCHFYILCSIFCFATPLASPEWDAVDDRSYRYTICTYTLLYPSVALRMGLDYSITTFHFPPSHFPAQFVHFHVNVEISPSVLFASILKFDDLDDLCLLSLLSLLSESNHSGNAADTR